MKNYKMEVLNKTLTSIQKIADLKSRFNNTAPFKYIVIDNFLEKDLARKITDSFPSMDSMKTKYKGLNENKAEDSTFENFSEPIQQLNHFISSAYFIEWISSITGFEDLQSINDRLGAGLHQGGNNSFLDIHIDYNIHPVKKLHRKLNLIIFFNEEWKTNWGGLLELWDKTNCFEKITPAFNRMVLFECNEISYHGYDCINCAENITRRSYYHYFFCGVPKGLSYHDTVFLLKPNDSLRKKILTGSKEFIKNKIKYIFFKVGFHKYLK